MTAPFVSTITKQPAAPGKTRERLRRCLLVLAALLPLILALVLVGYILAPKCNEESTDKWIDRIFHRGHQHIKESVCSLPPDTGPCRGALPRYHFSQEQQECVTFLYGGCEGNANNFETAEECRERCMSAEPSRAGRGGKDRNGDVCSQPALVGDCRAALPRFYFDSQAGECRAFTYGGCGGNDNNFKSREECDQRCGGQSKNKDGAGPDCVSEPQGGLCMAYMERYAYHPDTNDCQKFVYGGCGGNGNNYHTQEECEKSCVTDKLSKATTLIEGIDYDTRVCGIGECPADCGTVAERQGCMYCQCGHEPALGPGEQAVPPTEDCPPGHTRVREDFNAIICAPEPPKPVE